MAASFDSLNVHLSPPAVLRLGFKTWLIAQHFKPGHAHVNPCFDDKCCKAIQTTNIFLIYFSQRVSESITTSSTNWTRYGSYANQRLCFLISSFSLACVCCGTKMILMQFAFKKTFLLKSTSCSCSCGTLTWKDWKDSWVDGAGWIAGMDSPLPQFKHTHTFTSCLKTPRLKHYWAVFAFPCIKHSHFWAHDETVALYEASYTHTDMKHICFANWTICARSTEQKSRHENHSTPACCCRRAATALQSQCQSIDL